VTALHPLLIEGGAAVADVIGVGHGIWWVVYHLWNPVAVVPGRWLQRVAVALIAMSTVITILQTAVASLFIATVRTILKGNR
jgi:hypothetical protein